MEPETFNSYWDNFFLKCYKIRHFERCLLTNYSLGNCRGTIHTSIGQEYLPTLLAEKLKKENFVFGTHRSHAYYLSLTNDFEGLACEILDRQGATSKGIGGSQHLNSHNFFTNGIQGGMAGIAVGSSFDQEKNNLSITVLGDGSIGSGSVYESINVSKIFKTKTIFLVENNGIAQTTKTEEVIFPKIEKIFSTFGVPTYNVDTYNLQEMKETVTDIFSNLDNLDFPIALLLKATRLAAHSKGDDTRSKLEILDLELKDPLNNWIKRNNFKFNKEIKTIETEIDNMINEVLKREQNVDFSIDYAKKEIFSKVTVNKKSLALNGKDLVRNNLDKIFTNTRGAAMFGEDIEPRIIDNKEIYGGAFGVTLGLAKHKSKLSNFPISEQALCAFGIGRSLSGLPTVIEIMFADFSTLIVDSIRQQGSKMVSMYGKKIKIPLIIRLASGGRRGYGPTHSQNFETLFIGIPNVIVISLNNLFTFDDIFERLFDFNLPCLVFENKDFYQYDNYKFKQELDYDYQISDCLQSPNRVLHKRQELINVTIVTYGNAFNLLQPNLERIGIQFDLFLDIHVYNIISPFNSDFILESLNHSKILVILEEPESDVGITSMVLSDLRKKGLNNFQTYTVGGNGIIGASKFSENYACLNEDRIMELFKSISEVIK